MSHPDDKYLLKPQTLEQRIERAETDMVATMWEEMLGVSPEQRVRALRSTVPYVVEGKGEVVMLGIDVLTAGGVP